MAQNRWMQHVKNFRKRNSKMSFRQVLKEAKKTYGGGVVGYMDSNVARNAGRVGGGPLSPMPLSERGAVSGGTRRSYSSRRTRRARR
jgi:hypothetical protein